MKADADEALVRVPARDARDAAPSVRGRRPHTLLVDGQPVAFRSYYTIPTTWRVRGRPVNALFGYVRILLRLLKDYGARNVPTGGAAGSGTLALGEPITHVAVLLDPSGGTFRHELASDYKAHRPELPDEFRAQLAQLPEATEAFNVATMRQPRFEADDLIATYARLAEEAGHRVTIVSSDKDLMQLVTDNVELYDPIKKERFGVAEVRARYGVEPSQMVDVQALAGDSVDNVRGVPGIGMKTAAALIAEFGSLDALLERTAEVKQKARRRALEQSRDSALLARELVRLDRFAPTPVPLDDLRYSFHMQRFIDYLEPLGFRSTIATVLKDAAKDREERERHMELPERRVNELFVGEDAADGALASPDAAAVREVEQRAADGDADALEAVSHAAEDAGVQRESDDDLRELTDDEMRERAPANVTLVRDVETARRVVAQLRALTHYDDGRPRLHACDTEAIDVDLKQHGPIGRGRVLCFTIFCGDDVDFGSGDKLFVDTLGSRANLLDAFRPYFEDANVLKVWHNYGFDRHALGNHGINVQGFGGDTMHMARLWDASRLFGKGGYSLEGLTRELLDR